MEDAQNAMQNLNAVEILMRKVSKLMNIVILTL